MKYGARYGWPFVALLSLGGCGDAILGGAVDPEPVSNPPRGSGDRPGAPSVPGPDVSPEPGYGPGPGQMNPDRCADVPPVPPAEAPLRLMTRAEYTRSVGVLFAGLDLPELQLVAESTEATFPGEARYQSVSSLALQAWIDGAHAVATAAVTGLGDWTDCGTGEVDCARTAVLDLASRAYRRPLDSNESAELVALFDGGLADEGVGEGLRRGINAVLQSPNFLFRPEVGGPDGALDPHELATRLAFLLTGSLPDTELRARADDATLLEPEVLHAQAERLLARPEARSQIRAFFDHWLELEGIDYVQLDPQLFPEFDEALRRDLHESALRFAEAAFWDEDSLQTLWSGSFGFVNDRLAPMFGVEPPGSDDLVRLPLDPVERRGILTQPGMLASTSHGIVHSPIFRGVTVLERIICSPTPAAPPGVVNGLEDPETDVEVCTTREQVDLTHTVGDDCDTCHIAIDGAGFLFENYDALGRYRTEENGCTVDASGRLPGSDIPGDLANAVAFAEGLAQSEQAAVCAAQHWFTFAMGRAPSNPEYCELVRLGRTAQAGFQDLVLELVTSPVFTQLPAR